MVSFMQVSYDASKQSQDVPSCLCLEAVLLRKVMAEGLTLLSCFLEVLGLDLGPDIDRSD